MLWYRTLTHSFRFIRFLANYHRTWKWQIWTSKNWRSTDAEPDPERLRPEGKEQVDLGASPNILHEKIQHSKDHDKYESEKQNLEILSRSLLGPTSRELDSCARRALVGETGFDKVAALVSRVVERSGDRWKHKHQGRLTRTLEDLASGMDDPSTILRQSGV